MTPWKISATDLSWWAEAADGCRAEDLWVFPDAAGKLTAKSHSQTTGAERAGAVAWIPSTEAPVPGPRPCLGFTIDNGRTFVPIQDLVPGVLCDAFYVTASAVRKFLLPYYESHRLLTPVELEKLRNTDFANVIGVAHYPPSHSEFISPDGKIIGDAGTGLASAVVITRSSTPTEGPYKAMTLSAYAALL